MQNTYKHETALSPVRPFDVLIPTTRQFTGTPHVTRAYVLNKASGRYVEACGHKHRTHNTALICAEQMLARFIRRRRAAHKTA